MKINRFAEIRAAGSVPVGHMLMEFNTRGIAGILNTAGVDFVLIDMEHTAITTAQVADLVAWFRATPIAPFVRIPQIEHHFIARLMDAGALGLMMPDVQTAAAAREIVASAKYPPLGTRGLVAGIAHTDYQKVDAAEYQAQANENITIICQIESQAGLDNLEAIASTPGVDVLWVGQNDLSQALGIPGQFHHEHFLAAFQRVIDVAHYHRLGIGAQPRSIEQAQEWLAMGLNVVSMSSDLNIYRDALAAATGQLRSLLNNNPHNPS